MKLRCSLSPEPALPSAQSPSPDALHGHVPRTPSFVLPLLLTASTFLSLGLPQDSRACEAGHGSPATSILPKIGSESALNCTELVTHGQAGVGAVAEFFMELQPYHPEYQVYWEGALDWIVSTAEPQAVGAAWPWAYCDGVPQELSYIISIWNAEALTRGYLLNGDASYLPVIDDALAWVDSEKLILVPNTCIWIESVEHHEFSFTALFGVASFLKYNLEIYRATGNQTAAELAHCSAQALVDKKTADPLGVYWGDAPRVGFCSGSSGIIEALVDADLTFGGTHPQYGTTALAALDYLIATKDESETGYKWGVIATNPAVADAKVGLGVSAVGRAFLAAYDAYGDPVYLDHARGAADWVLSQAESPAMDQLKWADGDAGGGVAYRTSWCRGTAGVAHFLHAVTEAGAPPLYARAANKGANFLASTQVPTPSGPVMVQYEGSDEVTTDFIWGLAGLVNPIWQAAGGFALRPPLSDVVENAADWYIANKIDDSGLYSWLYNADADGAVPRPQRGPDSFDLRVFARAERDGYEITARLGDRSLEEIQALTYQVFDVGGRHVADGVVPRGRIQQNSDSVQFQWDGRDRAGRLLPRGAYIMNLRANDFTAQLKVAVLR